MGARIMELEQHLRQPGCDPLALQEREVHIDFSFVHAIYAEYMLPLYVIFLLFSPQRMRLELEAARRELEEGRRQVTFTVHKLSHEHVKSNRTVIFKILCSSERLRCGRAASSAS